VPTIKGIEAGPYRFFFYSFDCSEPMHVHVERERMVCKFWLKPIALAKNRGFRPRELTSIQQIIETHIATIEQQWNEHCDPE
jgi:hypothetical protein